MKLKLEDLNVESFLTAKETGGEQTNSNPDKTCRGTDADRTCVHN